VPYLSARTVAASLWLKAILGYALLSCVLTWPLALHLRTHLLGDPAGDLGTYVWNVWIFRHELLRHAHLPFSTNHVFAYTGGTDFALHNYSPLASIVGAPLIGPLGVVGAFNALVLVFSALSGISMFVLARRLRLGPAMAWVAGALFMAAPALVARDTAHFSLMIAAPLPLFLWSLLRTLDSRRITDAVLVGMIVAAAYYSDAYYAIYCVIMGTFVITWWHTHIEWPDVVRASSGLRRLLRAVIAVCVAVIGWRLVSGAHGFSVGPVRVGLETLYTPHLVLLVATVIRLWLVWRPTVRLDVSPMRLKELTRLGLLAVPSVSCCCCHHWSGWQHGRFKDGYLRLPPTGAAALAAWTCSHTSSRTRITPGSVT